MCSLVDMIHEQPYFLLKVNLSTSYSIILLSECCYWYRSDITCQLLDDVVYIFWLITVTLLIEWAGRLYQVEYAMEAIGHAGTCLGILANDGVLLAAERRNIHKLLDEVFFSEKIYKLNEWVNCRRINTQNIDFCQTSVIP